jgi:hypothetical protein
VTPRAIPAKVRQCRTAGASLVTSWILLAAVTGAAAADPAQVVFDDPALQVTSAIAGCPTHEQPPLTPAQIQAEAHSRAERGTRCYQSGRCRLPNAYLYDKEIIPRVRQAILADGRFVDTSVRVEGQRRWVWLQGCVRTRAQATALERLVGEIDDVERVIDDLQIKPR